MRTLRPRHTTLPAVIVAFAVATTVGVTAQHQVKAMSDADFVHLMTKHHQGASR